MHQPHDKLVKKLLSNPATARDILSLYLPKEVLDIADLNKLELQPDSFIDDEHRANAVDLLYKTTFQQEEGYIWLLLEHQRKSDHWMPVRIFKYISLIWDHVRKASKSKTIPLIYPLVIYNGNEPYAHSLTLSDLIQPEAAKQIFSTLFTKPFSLIDLPTIPDEMLREAAQKKVKGIALLMALKHVFDRNLQTYFEQTLLNVLKQLDREGGIEEISDILYYLSNEGKFLDDERFLASFSHQFSPEVESKMSTVVQQIEAKAIEKGKIEGKIEMARQLLADRPQDLSEAQLVALIQRATGLSAEKIQELQNKH